MLTLAQFLGFWCLVFLGRLAMASGWFDLLRKPFRTREHFVSIDARRASISDPRNYEMLTSPQTTFVTGEKNSPTAAPLMALSKEVGSPDTMTSPQTGSDYFTPRESEFKERTYSFSQPRPPSRAASKSSHRVTFSREGPASSPPLGSAATRDWVAFPEEGASEPHATLVATAVPQPPRSAYRQSPPQLHPRSGSALSSNGSAWERSPSALSNGQRAGSALGREQPGAALGREWQTPASAAGPGQAASALQRSDSALRRGLEWDPRSTYARGTGGGQWDGRP